MRVFPSIFYVYNQDEHSQVNLLKDLETLIFFCYKDLCSGICFTSLQMASRRIPLLIQDF